MATNGSGIHDIGPPEDDGVIEEVEGGKILRLEDEEAPNEGAERSYEFYDNIVGMFPEDQLTLMATQFLEDVKRDKEARARRDKEYAEAIKRTGLGKEAPGGAEFDGASKAVHPMLTKATIDFQSRA